MTNPVAMVACPLGNVLNPSNFVDASSTEISGRGKTRLSTSAAAIAAKKHPPATLATRIWRRNSPITTRTTSISTMVAPVMTFRMPRAVSRALFDSTNRPR